jgi:hypothetical protein
MTSDSIHAVSRPAAIPARKNGDNGATSRVQDSRPRFHQKIKSNAAGNVAVTVLESNPRTKRPIAARYALLLLS